MATATVLLVSQGLNSGPAANVSAPAVRETPEALDESPPVVSVLSIADATVLRNPGEDSAQILWTANAPDAQMTI
ncbi:hypothetical protein BH93_19710 [Rhodococcoides fascians A25f]|uniref:hypothetical protein n=1 Tax=Rhodococcoides fascians TaxID=1828 RepID=UPI00056395CE|nr:hypothetical protein [Rhodococcus fascians]QII07294.1 hypothetical protein BH93_19710 [Rhodococcus fascians A25f]